MKKLFFLPLILCSCIFMLLNQDVFAVNRNGALIITPMVGRYRFATKRHLDSQTMGSVSIGYGLNDNWSAELFLGNLSTYRKTDDEGVSGGIYTINGLYSFLPNAEVQPYLLAGVGVINLHPAARGDADVQSNINAGVGIAYYFNEQIGLRADIRDIYTMAGGKNDVMANLGLSIFFFGKAPVHASKKQQS